MCVCVVKGWWCGPLSTDIVCLKGFVGPSLPPRRYLRGPLRFFFFFCCSCVCVWQCNVLFAPKCSCFPRSFSLSPPATFQPKEKQNFRRKKKGNPFITIPKS